LTLIPWQRGKPLTWDVTVAHTLADSYVSVTARSGGAAAEQVAGRKTTKYDPLVQTGRLFQPIAADTLGPLNESSIAFFSELGCKIASISGDNLQPSFLFQRISITVQRFNSIMLHNSFSSDEERPLQLFVLLLALFLTLGIFKLEGKKIMIIIHTSAVRS